MTITVNPCRPGFGSSCSFCCGSHNFTLPPGQIEELFINRGLHYNGTPEANPEHSCEKKLIKEGMQCPHIGISGSEPSLVCCLAYNDPNKGSELLSFFSGTCNHFKCVAFNYLTDREVLFAAALMKDWYYYSLLINCIETLKDLYAEYGSPENVPEDVLSDVKEELVQKLMEDDMI